MNRRSFLGLAGSTLFYTGCKTIAPIRYESSDTYVAKRKASAVGSLEEKAAYFEDRVPLVDGMVPRHSKGAPFYDVTVQYLAALAAKQRTNPTVENAERIDEVMGAITAMPLRDISSNKYGQLFFAYSMMQEHPGVREHAEAIESFLFEYDLLLPGTFSDLQVLKMKSSRSRILDTLVLAEGLDALTHSDRPGQLLKSCIEANYLKKIQTLEIDVGFFKIPTHSSDWLFMVRLGAIMNFNSSPEYKSALARAHAVQVDERNALFEAIAKQHGLDAKDPLEILAEYPLINTNGEVVHRSQRWVWVKNDLKHQRKKALPVYARGAHYNVWKKNPFEAKTNLGSLGDAEYFGIDFLLPYYVAQMSNQTGPFALVVEDRKLHRDQVVDHLKERGYTVLQAGTLEEAKTLATDAEVIITDMDLSKLGGGFGAKNDGIDFLKWVRQEMDAGNISPKEVMLHSTVLNDGDPMSFLADRTKQKVEALGFSHQKKSIIVEE